KLDLYSMVWDVREESLRECLVAAAPYGGPIALLKPKKDKSPGARPELHIYSASGVRLASTLWKNCPAVHLGWTASEDLLCIQEDGSVLVYSIFCEFKRCFRMGNEVLQNHVVEAKVFHTEYGTGVAILTGANRFILATNVDDLKLRRMPEVPGLQKPPSCWAVLCQDRVTILLLAIGQDLLLLDNTTCSTVTLPGMNPLAGSYLRMAVSFNYRYLALFTDTGYVWMGMSHLKEKLYDFTCNLRTPPKQMFWCTRPRSRQRAVALAWDRLLLVAGNAPKGIEYHLDEDSYLVPELDGVRIFSSSTHEFLHEIPESTQEIFKIASMAPGALLLEAQKAYEKESQKADEYLREIREQDLLPEAVRKCIEAASYEHDPETQKALLRAASFGKCFVDKFPPESFVESCRDLRVLSAIRDYQIGIPLSYAQYKQLTIEVLLDRLVLRRLYPIAIKICEYLRLSEFQGISRILAHWACYKLLEYEPRSGKQVPLLLKMTRSTLALSKAIESGDTDLVYTVVLHLKNVLNRGSFFMTLQNQPVALSLYRQFCKHQELDTLKDLYNQDDDHQELGNFFVRSSYTNEQRIEGRVASLMNAVDEYYKAKNEFAAKATEDQVKLLRFQHRMQKEEDRPYLDYSLHDTVYKLILDKNHKKAEQLYRDFKIPDKRFWWLKVSALAEREDWDELEKFSKCKKSPIGYMPFVEICMKHHNRHEAKKYTLRVAPEQRVKALILVGDLGQAADAAIEHKNENEMNLVLSKCTAITDSSVANKINCAKAQILKK
ncbi:PREDICTED: vacuolar protein sorting-associated protein 16 homolog, partial [Gekko japonicus]|uniref:Vacuolar protein sorting-associated protein 16 homolog n=1 Tax=Gekko japonicus TaxID=146911 RepID=A0ABM1KJ84_GEKJA